MTHLLGGKRCPVSCNSTDRHALQSPGDRSLE
jgi:hypothetical protein